MTYGYIRVSTREQNLDRQYDSMHGQGLEDSQIFADEQSGKNFDRPAYNRMLKKLRPGDTVIFHSLDRMGRNYEDMGEQWRIITRVKKANIKVLDMPLLDTDNRDDITSALIADIVFKLLCYVAQTERENMLKRQAEGIRAARERGARFGRRPMEKPPNYVEVRAAWYRSEISGREAARRLGISRTTFQDWMRKEEEEIFGREHESP